MARVGQLRVGVWAGSLLLGAIAVACGDDGGDGGGGAAGAADAGAPHSGGSGGQPGGGTTAGGTTAGGKAGGENAGAPSNAGDSPIGGGSGGSGAGGDGAAGDGAGGAVVGGPGGAGGDDAGGPGGAGGHDAGSAGGAGGAGGESSTVTWLDECEGIDLSADGKTVLATRGIWRAESGWVALPDLPGGGSAVVPRALSRDGTVVFGNSGSALGLEATRWKNGVPTALGTLNTPYATNGDGSLTIGLTPIEPRPSEFENDIFDVFLWSEADGIDLLDSFWDAVDEEQIHSSDISLFMQEDAAAGAIALSLRTPGQSTSTTFRWSGASTTRVEFFEERIDALSPSGVVGAFHNHYRLTRPVTIRRVSDFVALASPKCASPPDDVDNLKCFHVYQLVTGFDQSGQRGVGIESTQTAPERFFHWQQGQDAQMLVAFLGEQGVTLTLPNSHKPTLAKMSADGRIILGSLTTGTPSSKRCFLARY